MDQTKCLSAKLFPQAVMLTLALIFAAPAQADMEGLFMMVKGNVTLKVKGGSAQPAKIGSKLHEGDQVVSGADSRAKIVMSDKNVLNISPDTSITIDKYRNDSTEKNVEIKVDQGKLRSSVEQKYDGAKSQYNVHTPTAVAGVRGTDFITSYDPMSRVSQFVTFHGVVTVSQVSNGVNSKSVQVKGGNATVVNPNGTAPETPKTVPPAQMQQLNTQTSTESSMNKGMGPSREIASINPAGSVKAPTSGMMTSSDLSPDVAKNLNLIPPPTGTAVITPPPTVAPPLPPSSTLLQNAVGGAGNAKVNISITYGP